MISAFFRQLQRGSQAALRQKGNLICFRTFQSDLSRRHHSPLSKFSVWREDPCYTKRIPNFNKYVAVLFLTNISSNGYLLDVCAPYDVMRNMSNVKRWREILLCLLVCNLHIILQVQFSRETSIYGSLLKGESDFMGERVETKPFTDGSLCWFFCPQEAAACSVVGTGRQFRLYVS